MPCGRENKSFPPLSAWALPFHTGPTNRERTSFFDQLVFVRLAKPIEWADDEVTCVLGIASQGDGHVELLGNLAEMIQDEDKLAILQNSQSPEEIAQLLLGND